MPKDRDDKRNSGAPGGGDFSLEEILAEFGDAPRRNRDGDRASASTMTCRT